jgi:hypothetical protein
VLWHQEQGFKAFGGGGGAPVGSAINYPGNPRSWPHVVFKMATTIPAMIEREEMLSQYTLLVKEEGPLGLRSCEQLMEVIFHHFGVCKHEMYVYHSNPHPFIVIFSEKRARDVVFTAGRLIDGVVELSFSVWELDEFGERSIIPYHVRLIIEGLPQHVWSQESANKVLYDEVVIHHVEEGTRKKIDQRFFVLGVQQRSLKDPSDVLPYTDEE